MNSSLRLAALVLGLCAISGCGQKGALYLPDPKPQAVPASPGAPPPSDAPERRKTPTVPPPATTQ